MSLGCSRLSSLRGLRQGYGRLNELRREYRRPGWAANRWPSGVTSFPGCHEDIPVRGHELRVREHIAGAFSIRHHPELVTCRVSRWRPTDGTGGGKGAGGHAWGRKKATVWLTGMSLGGQPADETAADGAFWRLHWSADPTRSTAAACAAAPCLPNPLGLRALTRGPSSPGLEFLDRKLPTADHVRLGLRLLAHKSVLAGSAEMTAVALLVCCASGKGPFRCGAVALAGQR